MSTYNPHTNENDIFLNFKKGQERAFDFYFNNYYSRIVGFCIQFLKDEDKSKSIAQEAFIHLWKSKETINTPAGIKSFLYTSAKSNCLNILRHEIVKQKSKSIIIHNYENQLNIDILESFKFDSATLSELESKINHCIENLPEPTKTIFIKKRIENLKNAEIASILNLSIKSIEAHMTKALKYFRIELADYLS
ncbi:RNA polymerase sigma-70 factor [Paucihalobacter ruber]|uniref:RNA polymerase sigma-70 factor n=1 Tax=Paucihalobacter ruber TaxID=2567861 RepID=A0A506PE92_9FLAO|nr:RNA polymerase sigma-70 factor [Paucihalobacter ruber]TPV31828.1 RNA polymerase sigma-70 factor [Paucihalobacter ruber]